MSKLRFESMSAFLAMSFGQILISVLVPLSDDQFYRVHRPLGDFSQIVSSISNL